MDKNEFKLQVEEDKIILYYWLEIKTGLTFKKNNFFIVLDQQDGDITSNQNKIITHLEKLEKNVENIKSSFEVKLNDLSNKAKEINEANELQISLFRVEFDDFKKIINDQMEVLKELYLSKEDKRSKKLCF